jgi:hypothetical protein
LWCEEEEHKQKSIADATRRVELNSIVKILSKITILQERERTKTLKPWNLKLEQPKNKNTKETNVN